MTADMSDGPLAGIRVLELSRGRSARTAGMLLADFGADVARLVTAEAADAPPDAETLCWDRGKTRVRVDNDRDAEDARPRLLAAADILLTDEAPSALVARKIDALTIRRTAPHLNHVWMPPYAVHGRFRDLAEDPLLLAALGGYADHHPATEDVPVAPVVPTHASVHGALGAGAAVAALLRRANDGRGCDVAVTGLHAMAATLGSAMLDAIQLDRVFSPSKQPSRVPFNRPYRGSDGRWFFLAAFTADFFFRTLDVVDRMDLMVSETVAGEFTNLMIADIGGPVGAALEERFATAPTDDWLRQLAAAGVPVAPVETGDGWLDSEMVSAVDARFEAVHPQLGAVKMPNLPVRLSSTPGSIRHLADAEHVVPLDQLWKDTPARTETDAPDGHPLLPLDGLRVVDVSTFLAGPFCGALLADNGAHVIKVEPIHGDPYRIFPLPFVYVNQRKEDVALDVGQTQGRDALLALVRDADVLVHNLRTGSLERLGLTDDVLARTNPRLIRCAVSAFGHDGEFSSLPGFDPLMQALSGLAAAQGGDGPPVFTVFPPHDVATGAVANLGVLAALFARVRTGCGQQVFTSLAAVSTLVQSSELTWFEGRPPRLVGGVDFVGPSVGHRYYQANDGWFAIAAHSQADMDRVLTVAGDPEWSSLDDDALGAALSEVFVQAPAARWVDALDAAGVPACPVLDRHHELDDPFLVENGFAHVVTEPTFGPVRVVRTFADWGTDQHRRPPAGPPIGRDSRSVLISAGFTSGDVDAMFTSRAATAPAE